MSESGNETKQSSEQAAQVIENSEARLKIPDEWDDLLKEEIRCIQGQRSIEQKSIEDEIKQRSIFLGKWKPPMKMDELEQKHGLSKIENAQLWFKKLKTELEKEKDDIAEFSEKVKEKINTIEAEIKQKENELNQNIDRKIIIPEKLSELDKKIKNLEDEISLVGEQTKIFKSDEKAKAEEELDKLKSSEYRDQCDAAIKATLEEWLKAKGELKSLKEEEEDISIEKKVREKTIEYYTKHQYYLMKIHLD